MGNTLKVKRGTNLSNAGTPAAGELIYKTDTNQLFVGDGSTAATSLTAIGGSGATGDIEGVTAGTGLSGGGTSGTVSLAVDLSELTDMTASVNSSQDELIILDNGADRRKLISEIPLSAFNNDSGFITATLTTEAVQDIVGAMFDSNTETRGSLTYDDSDGTIDLVVDDMTANDNTFRTVTAGGNTLGASETLAFTAGSNITISESGGAVTIASTDTNTQLSTEQVQDIVGAMFDSNTETRISASYQDGDGTIDLVVDDMTANDNTVTTNVAGTGVSVSSGTGNSTISIGQSVGTSDTVAFGRVNLGSTNDSTYLSGNSLLTADGYIMVQGIVNESETGGAPAAITFGDGATLGNDQISLVTNGNTRIHLDSSGVMTFNGTVAGTAIKDQDDMSSNSATHLATQQSIKAYVDAEVAGIVNSAPSALNTLDELAAALGDDANFATTTSTSLGNRLRVDTASQGLTGTQQANAITNLGITATKAELNYVDGVTSNIQTQLDALPDTAGTNITLSGTTLNVDDAFLKNDADDTTSGTVTGAGFNATNYFQINKTGSTGSLLKLVNSGWSNATTHDIIYNSYLSNLGDFTYLKSAGNSTAGHGIAMVADSVFAVGDTSNETGNPDNDAADPFTDTWFTVDGSGNGVFKGTVTATDLDISGDVDVDGTLETDALTINGTASVAFTSADHSKLDGIASGATANTGDITSVTAGTNCSGGGSSGDVTINVDDAFITNNADDTMSGILTISDSNDLPLRVLSTDAACGIALGDNSTTSNYTTIVATGDSKLEFNVNNTERLELGAGSNGNIFRTDHGYIQFGPLNSGGTHIYTDTSQFFFNKRLTIGVTSGESIIGGYGDQADLVLARNHGDTDHDAIHIGDNDIEFHCNDVEIVSFNSSGITTSGSVTLASFVLDGNTISGIDDSGEFTNDDAHIMTSAGVEDKILGYGYTTNTGDITAVTVTAGDGLTGGGTANSGDFSKTLHIGAGTGITVNSNDIAVTAAQTGITSVKNTSLVVGRDSDNGIHFSTDNAIKVEVNGVQDEFRFVAGGEFHADADIVAFSSTTASDRNLKENIEELPYGLDDVMKMRAVEFDWKKDKANGKERGHDIGVIAQEMEEVIPEVVKEYEGLQGKDNFKAVSYSKIVPVLIKAVQELKAEIEELKK